MTKFSLIQAVSYTYLHKSLRSCATFLNCVCLPQSITINDVFWRTFNLSISMIWFRPSFSWNRLKSDFWANCFCICCCSAHKKFVLAAVYKLKSRETMVRLTFQACFPILADTKLIPKTMRCLWRISWSMWLDANHSVTKDLASLLADW